MKDLPKTKDLILNFKKILFYFIFKILF